jgi:hypothetical protein
VLFDIVDMAATNAYALSTTSFPSRKKERKKEREKEKK